MRGGWGESEEEEGQGREEEEEACSTRASICVRRCFTEAVRQSHGSRGDSGRYDVYIGHVDVKEI